MSSSRFPRVDRAHWWRKETVLEMGGGFDPRDEGKSSSSLSSSSYRDVKLHLALFAIQCVCAIYNTLCQLFLNKDTDADDWRAVLVFSLYRDVLAAPLLYLCAFTHDSRAFKWFPNAIDFPRVLSQAFLGIFCNQLASLLGIQLVGAVMASLVHLATPMFAMAIAVCLGQEKLNAFIDELTEAYALCSAHEQVVMDSYLPMSQFSELGHRKRYCPYAELPYTGCP